MNRRNVTPQPRRDSRGGSVAAIPCDSRTSVANGMPHGLRPRAGVAGDLVHGLVQGVNKIGPRVVAGGIGTFSAA